MKIIFCYLLLVWVNISELAAQEGVITNFFHPSWMDTKGKVDSLFQVNYRFCENNSVPTLYKDYVFDDKGHVISFMSQEYRSPTSIFISTVYNGSKISEEMVSLSYLEESTNTFVYDGNGNVKEIRNKEAVVYIQYDDQKRISRIQHAYISDGLIFEEEQYNHVNSSTYSVTKSSEGEIYSTTEFKDGKCVKSTQGITNNHVTTYSYNKYGDQEEVKITRSDSPELIIKTDYEYDDRGNWIKCTDLNYNPGEQPYSNGFTTRKIIYKDGHRTGYDVTY